MDHPTIICIEGLDGSGKSTVARALVRLLKNAGFAAEYINYSDSPIGRYIRRRSSDLAPHVRYLLNAAAFAESFSKRTAGSAEVIVADRYAASVHSYYRALGLGEQLVPTIDLNAPECAMEVLLECPPKVRLARILDRDGKISGRKKTTGGQYGLRVMRHLRASGRKWLVVQSDRHTPTECAEIVFNAFCNAIPSRRSSKT